jgi:hypothetical protein
MNGLNINTDEPQIELRIISCFFDFILILRFFRGLGKCCLFSCNKATLCQLFPIPSSSCSKELIKTLWQKTEGLSHPLTKFEIFAKVVDTL